MLSSVCTGCGFRNEFSTIWLPVLWRTEFYMATHHVRYLGPLIRVDDLPGRRQLRSANTNRLVVRQVKLSTVGSRPSFCGSRHLEQTANWRRRCKFTVNFSSTVKTFFIPAIISWFNLLISPNQWSLQWLCHLGHFKNSWLIDWLTGGRKSETHFIRSTRRSRPKNYRFELPFGGLRGNAQSSSMARWKAHCRLPLSDNWTIFASSHGWGTIRRNLSKSAFSEGMGY